MRPAQRRTQKYNTPKITARQLETRASEGQGRIRFATRSAPFEQPCKLGIGRWELGVDAAQARPRTYNPTLTMRVPQGTRLGHYEILAAIGAGGMGEVYRARDTRLQRPAAVKVIIAEGEDPERVRRLEHEALAASALNHPNILTVYEFGVHEGLQLHRDRARRRRDASRPASRADRSRSATRSTSRFKSPPRSKRRMPPASSIATSSPRT